MRKLLLSALFLLTLTGSYLYFYDSISMVYISSILLHAGIGIVVCGVLIFFIRKHFSETEIEGKIALALLAGSGITGLILFRTGTALPYRGLLLVHIAFSIFGLLFLFIHLVHRKREWKIVGSTILASLLVPVAVSMFGSDPYEIRNPVEVPTSMEQETGGSDGPFFPSSAQTDVNHVIPSDFFMGSESCARTDCHPDIYEQWETSAHRFASFNNQWYRKSIEYMQEVAGVEASKWCAGCHDHALIFSGLMDKPASEVIDLPEAHVGLTCTSCHSIVSVKNTMGNGGFVIEYPPLHDLATSENPFISYLHDLIVKLDPGPHKKTFMKPFMREQTAEYCSSCHKVHLDVPVNKYRWIRGFNEYDSWQSSGVSGQGARSFYYPDQPKDCVDCHMPIIPSDDAGSVEGVVHDHRFPGANTAVPFANHNHEQFELVKDFLQNDQVSIDIFAASDIEEEETEHQPVQIQQTLQVSSTFAEGDEMGFAVGGRGAGFTAVREIIAPLNKADLTLQPGETFRVDVVLRTKGIGHFFPGGTIDAFEVWVELKATDENDNVIFWSGFVPTEESGKKGPVDPSAHFYRSLMLDEHGNRIDKRNAFATRSVVYVRLIPPGAADTIHYKVKVPEDAGNRIRLTAKINYRKFSWFNTNFSYAGVRDPEDKNPSFDTGYDDGKWLLNGDTSNVSGKMKEVPDLPIITMAETSIELPVGEDSGKERVSVFEKEDLIRWNDYGIGLLLQGDLKAAESIFIRVTEIDPAFADGWVNVGRARVLEGRTDEAQEVLLKALELDPELAKTHFFLGMTYKNQGEYDRALEHFRTASSKYPKDRVVLNQIGRILFLQRKFEESVEILKEVLRVDPEDLQAHYNLMLCYRALRQTEKAKHEQALYMRFKADESAQSIAGPYLLKHPEDNNERQAIHEHGSYPLDKIPASSRMANENQTQPSVDSAGAGG